jgi:CYTH domain-containing protein
MSLEIERKFRVVMDPEEWDEVRFTPLAAWEIWQGYLTSENQEPEVRVRMARKIVPETAGELAPRAELDGDEEVVIRWLAVKKEIPTDASGALSRHEIEPEIDEAQFRAAWNLCEGSRLRKIRVEYMVDLPSGHRVVVVDTFRDHLEGLVLAEVEFGDWKSSTAFQVPGFLGFEVTHDARYRNAALARATRPPEVEHT